MENALLAELEATVKRMDIIGKNSESELTQNLAKQCAFAISQMFSQAKAAYAEEEKEKPSEG